jgi:hypothetical protein
MKAMLRRLIKATPALYGPAKRRLDPAGPARLCQRGDDLCIEGYPASGNSYAYNLIRLARPELTISHHCHSIANLKLALKYNVPAVAVIRQPLDAVASRIVRFQAEPNNALREYEAFAHFLLKHRQSLLLLTFDEVVHDTAAMLDRVSSFSGIALQVESVAALQSQTQQYMEEWSRARDRGDAAALPREGRNQQKAKVQAQLQQTPALKRAHNLWQQLLEDRAH